MTATPRLAGLSVAYLRRLVAPAGLGDLVPADLAGEVGSIVGGGGVRVMLRIDGRADGRRVRAASFRALGSEAARGPGSVFVERAVGAPEAALATLSAADLLAPLGDVPPAVVLAADRCVAALARALEDGGGAARVDAPGLLTCRCIGVGDREIRRAIRRGATTVPMIGADCAAGTGCHSCWPDLRQLLDDERSDRVRPAPTGTAPTLVDAIRALVGPLWRAQGIRLGAIAVAGSDIALDVASSDPDALASPIGAVAIAQHVLRETLDPTVRVGLGRAGPTATPPAP